MNTLQLKKNIMMRVRFLYGVKKATQPVVVEAIMVIALLFGLKEAVFVRSVFANVPWMDNKAMYHFALSAFMNTQFIVQVFTLGVLLFGVLCAKNLLKKIFASDTSELARV